MGMDRSNRIGVILFLIPAVALLVCFFIIPVGYLVFMSSQKWDGLSAPVFNGIGNFVKIFKDPVFNESIINNVIWALMAGLVQVPLAMITAILLSQKMHGWKIFRTVYFLPQVISGVALATMWAAVYNACYGLLDGLLKAVGLGFLQRNWLGNLDTAFPAALLYWVPYIGYFMVIILADVQSIPEDYYEAASLDGAGKFRQSIAITLPLIKGSVVTCMTLAMINGLRQFEQVYMLTNGGPANRTTVMVLYLYNQMKALSYGTSSAASIVLIFIGTIVILSLRLSIGRKTY